MSIFSKPISQLGTADLDQLLSDRAVENVRLEFKLEFPSKDEMLKKLSSFANAFGGFMVIGAKANSASGRIENMPGVDAQPGFKQKIVQWCFDGASPPLIVEVSEPIPTPAPDGKVCYVIYTPESDVAPHFLNGRKGIWVRNDEFSARFDARLATENELRHLFDRRKLILERRTDLLERAERRFDSYAAETHPQPILGKAFVSRTHVGSILDFCVVPRFPARPVCQQDHLVPCIMSNLVQWRGIAFPRLGNNIVTQHESAIVLRPCRDFSMFEANIWGLLFYGTQIDGDHNGTIGIHLYEFVGTLMVFLQHAGKMLHAIGYTGPILIETALSAILGVQWLHAPQGWLSISAGSKLDDHFEFSIEKTSESLQETPDAVAMEILCRVFFSVNWPDLIDSQKKLEDLIRDGYKYNRWQEPANLRV